MIQRLHFQSINLLNTAHLHVANILGNGLDPLLLQAVFSKIVVSASPVTKITDFRALCQENIPNELKVYLTRDGADVYEDSLFKLAKANSQTFHPVLILVGIRLGIDRVTPVYWEALKGALQLPQSLGIAG